MDYADPGIRRLRGVLTSMQAEAQIRNKGLAAIWPSLFVLAVTGALIGGLLGVGFYSVSRMDSRGEFLPTHRAPWFAESAISYGMAYASNTEDQNDVLITGGSAGLAGLVTRSFEDATDTKAYNFGTVIDIGPEGHFEFVRAYNRRHDNPEAIIYVATARDVGFDYSFGIDLLNRFSRVYAPSVTEQQATPVKALKAFLVEGKLAVETMARPFGLHPFDQARGRRLSHNDLGPSLTEGRGFQEYPQYTRIDASYLEDMDEFPMSDWYDNGFREMAQEAQDLGIQFDIYFTPIPTNDLGVDDAPLIAWAEQFEADFPGSHVYGLPLVQYDLGLWGNGFHLNREGAELFTGVVADTFKSDIAVAEGQ